MPGPRVTPRHGLYAQEEKIVDALDALIDGQPWFPDRENPSDEYYNWADEASDWVADNCQHLREIIRRYEDLSAELLEIFRYEG